MLTVALLLVASGPRDVGLPAWYVHNRVHAHSRMSIESQCRLNTTTNTWGCSDQFDNEAARFAQQGIKAFVRHTHTADEGAWWPSATGPAARSMGWKLRPKEYVMQPDELDQGVLFKREG